MIDIKACVKSVVNEVTRLEREYLSGLAQKVLGINSGHWGQIEKIDPEMIARLRKEPEVIKAQEHLETTIKDALVKQCFTKKGVAETVRTLRTELLHDATRAVRQELFDVLKESVAKELREKINQDPYLVPYLVASKFVEANKNAPRKTK